MKNLDAMSIGVFLISASVSITLATAGIISWLVVIPMIISIMGIYGVVVSLIILNKSIYHLGWSLIVMFIGVFLITNIMYPELSIYVLSVLIGFMGLVIVIASLRTAKKRSLKNRIG